MKEYVKTTLNPQEIKVANQRMLDWLSPESGEEGSVKAGAAATDMIRVRVREGSIARNILKPRTIGAADLIPSLTDDDPRYIGEIEPDTPGGVVLPLAARPLAWYFFGKRYEARFNRLETPRYQKDTTQLLTYKTDLRQFFSDASLRDLLALEDSRFLQMVNLILEGRPATGQWGADNWTNYGTSDAGSIAHAQAGVKLAEVIEDDINPASVTDALTIMNRSNFGLDPATALINLNFAKQFMKWDRNAFGGDLAEEVKKNGFAEREFMGVRWIVTIKNWLVKDGEMYMFAPQEFIGETLILTDSTMHVRKDAYMIEFWSYQEIAQIIANYAGMAKATFTGSGGRGLFGSDGLVGLQLPEAEEN